MKLNSQFIIQADSYWTQACKPLLEFYNHPFSPLDGAKCICFGHKIIKKKCASQTVIVSVLDPFASSSVNNKYNGQQGD